ncbi:hypothetical protein K090096B2_01180 [Bacteroides fragilis]
MQITAVNMQAKRFAKVKANTNVFSLKNHTIHRFKNTPIDPITDNAFTSFLTRIIVVRIEL